MDNIKLRATPSYLKKRKEEGLRDAFKRIVLEEKLKNSWGYAFFALCSLSIGAAIAYSGIVSAAIILAVIVGPPLVYGVVMYPKFGIIVLIIAAYLIMWIYRMGVTFPLGTLMDGLQALLILGFFIKQKKSPNWKMFKDPVGIIILVWVSYNILQFANPTAESRLAWVYTVRAVAIVMLMYFVFSYHITTVAFIKLILKVWIALAFFAAIYALKQEYLGFFEFEKRGLDDPHVRNLLFIGGHWRKFSIFSDPVAFSYNMVTACIFCVTLLFGPVSRPKKILLAILASFFIFVMFFSGTRGAYVLPPAAILLFAVLNFNKKVLLFSSVAGFFFAVLVFVPVSNPSIRRFQSAFRPLEDASFNVRAMNQKKIQPYLRTHPFGGGLGATGIWGVRFAPHSYLAQFPPDSGYVRVAVELGPVGLLLICTVLFLILKAGINNYYSIKNPELKTYCLAMTLIIFVYAVGNYPQEAIVQFPSNIYFYLFAALIFVTARIDKEMQKHIEANN
ncbi:O-antigen ligase family protein [Arcticibacter tournemirensis]|uniref:O-antigen ligase domain-containing protein n=2 Tax=Pseudomonadati TaxID=3379134 RepID=A0A4Q0MFF1_9SPHI|nr:O-antigen ligase family protein [Arcticibacter tournemirensis]RXF72220.1 O-antigen ligase domain-containing protein [Arcticibacter tournemirensis]